MKKLYLFLLLSLTTFGITLCQETNLNSEEVQESEVEDVTLKQLLQSIDVSTITNITQWQQLRKEQRIQWKNKRDEFAQKFQERQENRRKNFYARQDRRRKNWIESRKKQKERWNKKRNKEQKEWLKQRSTK